MKISSTSNKVLCLRLLLLIYLPLLVSCKSVLEVSGNDDGNVDDKESGQGLTDDNVVVASETNRGENSQQTDDAANAVWTGQAEQQHAEQAQGQYGAGSVEEMIHGDGDVVHGETSQGDDAKAGDDVKMEFGAVDVEHLMHNGQDVHVQSETAETQPAESQQQQQFGPNDVAELVHGKDDVNGMTSQDADDEVGLTDNDFKREIGAETAEHLMHGSEDVHEAQKEKEEAANSQQQYQEPFQAGNVEQMVHGEDHVHDDTKGQGQDDEGQGQQQQFSAGEDAVLKTAGMVNVHDPSQRAKLAMAAGDMSAFMGGGGGVGGGEGEDGGGGGNLPSVLDTEHVMHGEGGHDHDVRKLKDLKPSKADDEETKKMDRFSDLHNILMHDGGDDGKQHGHHNNDDDKIRRGKTITYRDIMELGLDEESLKGIDLKQLLLENAREYDDWEREKNAVRGESPETSFWEQLGELRKRYLTFGRNDGEARDLTGSKLDPSQQKWVSRMEMGAGEGEREDRILHEMEILGSTAAERDRHKQQRQQQGGDNFHTNGRDTTDL
ncbi:uncharacterized protein LOC143275524 isoform X2 [Babylonia areolata]